MEMFQVGTGLIIAAGAAVAAAGVIFKKFRGPIRRWLGVAGDTNPSDVKHTIEDGLQVLLSNQIIITDNQQILLEMLTEFAGDEEPSPEDIMGALQTLAAAGFSIGDDDDEATD
jgi:hypothetical protein